MLLFPENGFSRRLGMKVRKSMLYFICLFSLDSFSYLLMLYIFESLILVTGLNNLLKAYEDKSAYAMCIFSLALGPRVEPITFIGKTQVNHASCYLFSSQS